VGSASPGVAFDRADIDYATLGEQSLERVEPGGVVRGCGGLVLGGRMDRDRAREVAPEVGPRHVEPIEDDHCHAERPPLPGLLEHELAVIPRQRGLVAEGGIDGGQVARLGAHVIAGAPAVGSAVPIMQSRVTAAASASSLQPSVPSGRIGSTR